MIKSIRRRKRRSSTAKRPPQKRKKTKTQRKTPKPHTCRDCKMPMWSTTGHTQFRGKRYCPHAPGQMPKEDWLKQQRVAAGLTPTPSSVPRTTLWRQRKGQMEEERNRTSDESEEEQEKGERRRKVYTCRMCGQPMKSTGHTHFRGIRYCPNAPGQIPLEEWLTHRHIELKAFNKSGL